MFLGFGSFLAPPRNFTSEDAQHPFWFRKKEKKNCQRKNNSFYVTMELLLNSTLSSYNKIFLLFVVCDKMSFSGARMTP